jgi:hypothetical protein
VKEQRRQVAFCDALLRPGRVGALRSRRARRRATRAGRNIAATIDGVPPWLDTALAWLGVAFFGYLGARPALFNAWLFYRHVVLGNPETSYVFVVAPIAALGLQVFAPPICGHPLALTLVLVILVLDGLPLSLLEAGVELLRARRRAR